MLTAVIDPTDPGGSADVRVSREAWGRLGAMRGTWPRTRTLGVLRAVLWLAVLTAGCTTAGVGHGPTVSPPPQDDISPTPTATPSVSASPGPESPLRDGVASLILSGELTLTGTFSSIATPAVWAPPPAPMDVTWVGTGAQQLRLSGLSFVSLTETSEDTVLSFTVTGPDGPVAFSSTGGECSITITPALPDNMGGVFICTSLADVEGVTTVDARGTFSAIG
jgi:hypothetical protein